MKSKFAWMCYTVRKLKFVVLAAEVSDDKFKMKVVVAAAEVAKENVELSLLSEPKPEDALLKAVVVCALGFVSRGSRTFRSMKSVIKPGFVILSSLTTFLPFSILTTVDMDGLSFARSWVQRRPIFRNLQASSASKSPSSDVSTSPTSSFRS